MRLTSNSVHPTTFIQTAFERERNGFVMAEAAVVVGATSDLRIWVIIREAACAASPYGRDGICSSRPGWTEVLRRCSA